uniref:Ig-like domain-containing protein n=1 Tax=Xiphophorus couchianus TaxID=32473 RepID=A0A3B5KZA0_9TELE
MEKSRLYRLLYYFILNSPLVIYADATFTEVPKDVSVGEGEDVEMPCAFKALSSAPMSLEIQWWYIKMDGPKEGPDELQNRAKVPAAPLREATKISTVRIQGNAISHRLSLSKVKKEDGGVYECRVSDLWAEEDQDFTVHATLTITAGRGMVAEEAVSHIQNRWSGLRSPQCHICWKNGPCNVSNSRPHTHTHTHPHIRRHSTNSVATLLCLLLFCCRK